MDVALETSPVSVAPLFRSYRGDGLDLQNRVVMAPMTRERSPGGLVGPQTLAYYERRARQGVGLIITEGTWIDHPVADFSTSVPRFYGEDALAAWTAVADAVHAAGGKIMPQLWHVGTGRGEGRASSNPHLPSVGPSGIGFSDGSVATPVTLNAPMTPPDIAACIEAYGKAAEAAWRCGFDGVEIHGAHGYLIDQFFWPVTNRRDDAYNGSIRDRTRFAVEIVRECKRRTPAAFPLSFRFSQWKTADYGATNVASPRELQDWLEPLADAGVDIFHCSTRRFWEPGFAGSPLTLAGWTKKITGRTTIAVGSVGLDQPHQSRRVEQTTGYVTKFAPIDQLIDLLARDEFDLIAVGRALLADHAWVWKIWNNALTDVVPYATASRQTLY